MRGNYSTTQKKIIIEYLEKNQEKFVSVSDIYEELMDKNIGQVTIYRLINNLMNEKILRVEVKNNTKYYQLVSKECENHFHLKCTQCGKLIHLDCEECEELNKHIIKDHKFIIDCNAIIYGLCEKCSKRK